MKKIKIVRPDELIISGIKSLGNLSLNFYSKEKSTAKGKGEITFIGKKKLEKVGVQFYQYDQDAIEINEQVDNFEFLKSLNKDKVHWLNFHGLHEVELIQHAANAIPIYRITTRQILDTTQRPKVEDYEKYIFFSIKSILKATRTADYQVEQISFILGENYVVSFQEEKGDHFDHIRQKLIDKLGLIRERNADFLLYQLLDAILDNYYETIEEINQEVKDLEKIVLSQPSQKSIVLLEELKGNAEMIKKSLKPFQYSLRVIQNFDTNFIREESTKYYLELTNSCLGVIEEIDATINSLDSLTNIYFSALSQKMNEIMKVLTTVATIFIPLTFIAGIYGMNFENMPELKNPNGYFYTWGAMGVVLIIMIIYFKTKKWI